MKENKENTAQLNSKATLFYVELFRFHKFTSILVLDFKAAYYSSYKHTIYTEHISYGVYFNSSYWYFLLFLFLMAKDCNLPFTVVSPFYIIFVHNTIIVYN